MHRWVSAAQACTWAFMAATAGAGTSVDAGTDDPPGPSGPGAEASLAGSDSETALIEEARALLRRGRAEEAYALLSSHELELAGTPAFDYLLGVAAVDSGRTEEATFALERVLATQPEFAGARMELARARFRSGERELAKAQFEYLLTQSPPEATRTVIERYLDALAVGRGHPGWSALAQVGAGYDTNANASTSEQTFLGFTLNRTNVEQASSFAELLVGGNHRMGLTPEVGLYSHAQLSHRANPDASFVDPSVLSLGTTALWAAGAYRLSGGVDVYAGLLDGNDHERGFNFSVGASRQFADYEGTVSVRAGSLEYRDSALASLDVNRYLAGVSLTRSNLRVGRFTSQVGMAVLAGVDDERRSDSPYGNERRGARVFGNLLLRPQASLSAEVSHTRTDYDGPFFGTRRDDDQWGLSLALDLRGFPSASWSITPRVRYVRNDSTLALYEYDRLEAVVFVRRGF